MNRHYRISVPESGRTDHALIDVTIGTVYVVVESRFSSGDVGGTLLMDTGEAPWGHMSSSVGFLRGDLTTTFADRRTRLEQAYPDGYSVVVVDDGDKIPADVLAANERWAATRDDEVSA